MKTTLITTCFNEEKTISSFLRSIEKQTKKPSEVIIVDASSTDNTVKIIKEFKEKSRLVIKLLIKKGNRSIGRNIAIDLANTEIILCTDVGCILNKHWIENISKPFLKKNIDIVSGFYYPKTKSIFEKCLATYTCTMKEKVNPKTFLPSSRSVAFRKTAWKEVQGYPENLDTCEDLIFDKKLMAKKKKFYFCENAFVFWPQRSNFFQAFKQFFSYAVGDGQALFIRKQTPLLYLRYFLGLLVLYYYFATKSVLLLEILLFTFIVYVMWAILKNYPYVLDKKAIVFLPMLQITSDVAVLLGTTYGLCSIKSHE